MKSLNDLVFIILGALAIWIGATGRLPALAAALGMVRAQPGGGNKPAPTTTPTATPNAGWTGSAGSSAPSLGYLSGPSPTADWLKTTQANWPIAMKQLGWIQ